MSRGMPKSKRASGSRQEKGQESSSPATDDYRVKIAHEADAASRRASRPDIPYPSGDPLSGIVLVADPAPSTAGSARLADALRRSLSAVGLEDAYVTWSSAGLLLEELLSLEPTVLVAVGPGAARAVDDANYALVKTRFREAREGTWFPWTKGTTALLLPDLAPALDDAEAKRRFWRAFLSLRDLAPDGPRGA